MSGLNKVVLACLNTGEFRSTFPFCMITGMILVKSTSVGVVITAAASSTAGAATILSVPEEAGAAPFTIWL